MRVLYTVARMDVGGAQVHLLDVLRGLDRNRFEPALLCWTGRGALLESARDLEVPVYDGGLRNGFRNLDSARAIVRAASLFRRLRMDIVHNYLLRANMMGAVAARLARVPAVLVSKRGCHERRGGELVMARIGNALADRVVVNADAVRDFVHANERCPVRKMTVIPNGVDTERFRPGRRDAAKARLGLDPALPVVGIVTRMRVRKGVEEFLRAMAEVRARFPKVSGVIVGEVDLDARLQGLVAEAGLEETLVFLGRRSDMPEVYAAFDLFVLSSHDEGMPRAVLEAMAAGLPVVATDVGGTGEVVRHGRTGLLVPPRDPRPLAAAIIELLGDPERCRRFGEAGRERVVCEFSLPAMIWRMEQLYSRLLHARGIDVHAGS